MKAFVTGSTGLLGSNLVNLLLAQGWQVKALARSAEKARKLLGNTTAEIVVGDMEDIPAFAPALAGCDVLFHTAAYFREYYGVGSDHWTPLQKINVDGTIALLTEAEKHGVRKAIYVSSSGTIGQPRTGSIGDENTPPDDYTLSNLYFKSKVLSERALAEWRKTHTLPVVMILPTVMLGPQDAAPTAIGQAVIEVVKGKQPVIPPGGFEFVDARDVAQGMINAVERGSDMERYILSAGYYSMADMVNTVGQVAGVAVPRTVVPYPLMLAMAWGMETVSRLTGSAPLITQEAVRTMGHPTRLTTAKAQRDLGVTFRSFADSLRDEVAWFRTQGYVN